MLYVDMPAFIGELEALLEMGLKEFFLLMPEDPHDTMIAPLGHWRYW